MKYSNEEKLSIITRYQQGESIATLSDELDIPRSTLYRLAQIFSDRQRVQATEVFLLYFETVCGFISHICFGVTTLENLVVPRFSEHKTTLHHS